MKIESTQKGFTLIELMIVVAIIGILASIAIPQFSAFRIKAFNASANADVKNGQTTIEAAYTNTYAYPNVTTAKVSAVSLALASETWSPSKGVTIGHKSTLVSYILAAKHLSGDKKYTAKPGTTIAATAASEGVAMKATDVK